MTSSQTDNVELIFPYSRWMGQLALLNKHYREANPFPHIVLENFLNAQTLEQTLSEFPALELGDWIHYVHINEKKFGKTDLQTFGGKVRSVVEELNSDRFLRFLSKLTGIENLFADSSLEGGGLHQSGPGGFLNIHADFTVHPHHQDWRRRVNLLLYLNKNWEESYGGHLELWDKDMKRPIHKISPLFNRAVIFNTDSDSFHGHPDPIRCPEGMTRKSIALYYFTKERDPLVRSTEYRPRPSDNAMRSFWIYFDKMALRAYDRIKRFLGINDKLVSRFLKFFNL